MGLSLLKSCLPVFSVFFIITSCDPPKDTVPVPQNIIVKGTITAPPAKAPSHGTVKSHSPKKGTPSEPKKPKDPQEEALKAIAEDNAEPSYYDPDEKIDPFKPLFTDSPEIKTGEKSKRKRQRTGPKEPLEMIDLSQLKLTAITQAGSGNRALMEEASGKGHIVRKGMFIGKNAGKVLEIFLDRLVIEEEIQDYSGNYIFREKEIKLLKPDGE